MISDRDAAIAHIPALRNGSRVNFKLQVSSQNRAQRPNERLIACCSHCHVHARRPAVDDHDLCRRGRYAARRLSTSRVMFSFSLRTVAITLTAVMRRFRIYKSRRWRHEH